MGNKGTREIPAALGVFDSSAAAWERRVQSGQAGGAMTNGINNLGAKRALALFGDWTDRIAGRRGAAGAAAPAGRRAQRRDHAVGLGRSQGLPARRDRHRSSGTRPSTPTGRFTARSKRAPTTRPSSIRCATRRAASRFRCAIRTPRSPRRRWCSTRPPYWAEEPIWTSKANVHNPMLDHRGAAVADVQGPSQREPGDVPRGVDASVGEAHAGERRRAPPGDVRPGDEEDDAHRHLLRHAPPAVCRGCEQHAVDEQRRRRRRRRLAEHEDVRRDRRRGAVAGLDGARPRSQRQRQARRVHGRHGARRPDEGSARQRPPSTASRRARRTDRSGARPSASRARSSASCPGANPPATALAEVYEVPWDNPRALGAGLLAARHGHRSQRRRLGRRWRAATSAASIGGCARDR